MKIYIYGAKNTAIGIFKAFTTLYPKHRVEGFVVTSYEKNPVNLCGCPVLTISEMIDKDVFFLIATPENYHIEINNELKSRGFKKILFFDSFKEERIMKKYYMKKNIFSSIDVVPKCEKKPSLEVLLVKHHNDKVLQNEYKYPSWVNNIQVGAVDAIVKKEKITDDVGENISSRNKNYCELTALYWMWKNIIRNNECSKDYYGIFHYRRILNLDNEDLLRCDTKKIDVVLPYPMICEPTMEEHHTRYVNEMDWLIMIEALEKLYPDYAVSAKRIFNQPYMYNYNIFIATSNVIEEYCNWIFSVLDYVYQNSNPKGCERGDRYIGYLGESLTTLFFMYNKNKYRIFHTGRILLV